MHPDVSIDYYCEAHLKQFMEEEENLSVKAQEYKSALQNAANNGESEAKEILSDLDNGFREICYDNEYHIIAHLVDVKDAQKRITKS